MGRRLMGGGRPCRLGETGFSLLELIVVLAILGLVAAVGTPNVVSWLARLRSRAVADEVVSVLQSARLQAIARNTRLRVCLYSTATPHDFLTLRSLDALQPACPAPPATSSPAYAAFRRTMTELPGVRITKTTRRSFVFGPRGTAAAGSFTLETIADGHARKIIVAPNGRVRSEQAKAG